MKWNNFVKEPIINFEIDTYLKSNGFKPVLGGNTFWKECDERGRFWVPIKTTIYIGRNIIKISKESNEDGKSFTKYTEIDQSVFDSIESFNKFMNGLEYWNREDNMK